MRTPETEIYLLCAFSEEAWDDGWYSIYLYLLVDKQFLYGFPVPLQQPGVVQTHAKRQCEPQVLVLDRLQQRLQLERNRDTHTQTTVTVYT